MILWLKTLLIALSVAISAGHSYIVKPIKNFHEKRLAKKQAKVIAEDMKLTGTSQEDVKPVK